MIDFKTSTNLELVDYFIDKFTTIPDSEWCIGWFSDKEGRHCAYGHCGVEVGNSTDESRALDRLFRKSDLALYDIIAEINDGRREEYHQSTPKARILAALEDIKKKI